MGVLADPQTRLVLYYVAGGVLLLLILMTLYFFWRRVHKIRFVARKYPERAQSYSAWRILLDYFWHAVVVFLAAALIASVPLIAAIYFGVWLAYHDAPLDPLLLAGLCIGIVMGLYATSRFLSAKVTLEESKLAATVSDFV